MNPVEITQWNLSGPSSALPGAGASMRLVHGRAGQVVDRHSHAHEQFLLVLSGAGQLDSDAGPAPLRPGTAIRFAPGAWHSAEFTEDTVLAEFNLIEASV